MAREAIRLLEQAPKEKGTRPREVCCRWGSAGAARCNGPTETDDFDFDFDMVLF